MATVRRWNRVEQRSCASTYRRILTCPPRPETEKNPLARRRLLTCQGTQGRRGGCRLLRPYTHTRAKYHQPHRSGRQTRKRRDAGADTGKIKSHQVSHTGGRRIKTYGRRGGKRRREIYTRGQIGCRQGALGESWRGERGGYQNHQ